MIGGIRPPGPYLLQYHMSLDLKIGQDIPIVVQYYLSYPPVEGIYVKPVMDYVEWHEGGGGVRQSLTTRPQLGNRSFRAVLMDTLNTVMVVLGCYPGEVGVPLTWRGNFRTCGGNQRHRRHQTLAGLC